MSHLPQTLLRVMKKQDFEGDLLSSSGPGLYHTVNQYIWKTLYVIQNPPYFTTSIFVDAVRLIRNIKSNPSNAAQMKMSHFSNIGVIEVFLEATPTTFVTTVLLFTSLYDQSNNLKDVLWGNGNKGSGREVKAILFLLGYSASILSSAFGVSR